MTQNKSRLLFLSRQDDKLNGIFKNLMCGGLALYGTVPRLYWKLFVTMPRWLTFPRACWNWLKNVGEFVNVNYLGNGNF